MSETTTNSQVEDQPHDPDGDHVGRRRQPVGLLVLWCAVVSLAGGYGSGHALAALAILGTFSFLLLGVVAGWTARMVVGATGMSSAVALSASCLTACFIALVFHLRLTDPTLSWGDAFNWLGPSISSDKVFAAFALGCAAFGSLLASFFVLRKTTTRRAS